MPLSTLSASKSLAPHLPRLNLTNMGIHSGHHGRVSYWFFTSYLLMSPKDQCWGHYSLPYAQPRWSQWFFHTVFHTTTLQMTNGCTCPFTQITLQSQAQMQNYHLQLNLNLTLVVNRYKSINHNIDIKLTPCVFSLSRLLQAIIDHLDLFWAWTFSLSVVLLCLIHHQKIQVVPKPAHF